MQRIPQDSEDAKSLRNSLKKCEGQYCSWSKATCVLDYRAEGKGLLRSLPRRFYHEPQMQDLKLQVLVSAYY